MCLSTLCHSCRAVAVSSLYLVLSPFFSFSIDHFPLPVSRKTRTASLGSAIKSVGSRGIEGLSESFWSPRATPGGVNHHGSYTHREKPRSSLHRRRYRRLCFVDLLRPCQSLDAIFHHQKSRLGRCDHYTCPGRTILHRALDPISKAIDKGDNRGWKRLRGDGSSLWSRPAPLQTVGEPLYQLPEVRLLGLGAILHRPSGD